MSNEEEYRRGFDDGLNEAEREGGKIIPTGFVNDWFQLRVYIYPDHIGALTNSEAYQEGKKAGVKYYHDMKTKEKKDHDMKTKQKNEFEKDMKEATEIFLSWYDEEKKKKR